MLSTWYAYPRGERRASTYHYHERGKWHSADYWGESQQERDDKAVHYLRNRASSAAQCVIRCRFEGEGWEPNRCDEALLWERVEFLDEELRKIENQKRKEKPWPAVAP